jgi:hypothetical protein
MMRSAALTVLACAAIARGAAPPALLVEARLSQPLASHASRAGDRFQAVAATAVERDGLRMISPGTRLHGTVRQARTVGLGLARERASLVLELDAYELDGVRYPLKGVLRAVDNAREEVTREGKIRGVLSADNPQLLLHGLWRRPEGSLPHRSLFGLTGATGSVWTRYAMGPVGAAGLFAVRLAALHMPDPEIELPAGTGLVFAVDGFSADAPAAPAGKTPATEEGLAAWLGSQPYQLSKPNRTTAADIVNLAFLGSREDVERAFLAAGWSPADALNARTFRRAYKAYASMEGYPTAPASKLLYQQREPELVFQRSFNTIAMRHHVRIWSGGEAGGRQVWLAAATHDVGIKFSRREMSWTHKIDPEIDRERAKILGDLEFAGCLAEVSETRRPGVTRAVRQSNGIRTDGRVAVAEVWGCANPAEAAAGEAPRKRLNRAGRLARRVALETRHYLLRGNAGVFAWRATRHFRGGPPPASGIVEE